MSGQAAERLIIWNLRDDVSDQEYQRVVDLGLDVLAKIPGVTSVSFGIGTHDPRYRYYMRIRFRDFAPVAVFDSDATHIDYLRNSFAPILAGEVDFTYAI